MDQEIIELINNLLRVAYEFGWEVGASWDPKHYSDLVDIGGYLKDDRKIDTELKENAAKLLAKLAYNSEDYDIYTKEDCSIHENDWNYIAPVIEPKETK
jgi:hypothetical protein